MSCLRVLFLIVFIVEHVNDNYYMNKNGRNIDKQQQKNLCQLAQCVYFEFE